MVRVADPTSKLPDAHPWHKATQDDLSILLDEAQKKFGNATTDKSFEGIILGTENKTLIHPDTTKVFISLELRSEYDVEWARFQLAHECIHLLAPSSATNYLEEGWASHFSLNNSFIRPDRIQHFREEIEGRPEYRAAILYYEAFLVCRGEIKALRDKQPYISKVKASDIKQLFPACPEELSQKLVEGFKY